MSSPLCSQYGVTGSRSLSLGQFSLDHTSTMSLSWFLAACEIVSLKCRSILASAPGMAVAFGRASDHLNSNLCRGLRPREGDVDRRREPAKLGVVWCGVPSFSTSVLVVPDTVKCISLVGMCFRRAPHSASVIDLLATEY